jgi:hypothetical protein
MIGPMRRAVLAVMTVAACAPGLPGPQPLDLRAALEGTPQPAVAADGACWGRDKLSAEGVAGAGLPFAEAGREVWFQVPCAAEMTADFVATLQRALQVRGYFAAEVTGTLDDPTSAAVRRFQAARGFDSGVLTLAAARALGVAVTPIE